MTVAAWFGKTHRCKTPLVLQQEAMECGAAALSMILGYYGKFVPSAQLRRDCGVSRDGSKASKIVQAARLHGLVAKGFTKSLEHALALKAPFIAFWEFNHFIVVEGSDNRHIFINDPANGHTRLAISDFSRGFTGVVLTMEPGPDFKPGGERKRVIPALARRLSGCWAPIVFCLLAGILATVPTLGLAACSRYFVDVVLGQARESEFRPLVMVMAGLSLAMVALVILQAYHLRRLLMSMCARLTSGFVDHLLRLPLSFYSQRFAGEVSLRAAMNAQVAEIMTGKVIGTGCSVVSMIIYGVVLGLHGPVFLLVAIASTLLNFAFFRVVYSRQLEVNIRIARQTGRAMGLTVAGLQNIETLKASGTESGFFTKWVGAYGEAETARQQMETSTQWLEFSAGAVESVINLGIMVYGGYQVLEGRMTLGTMLEIQAVMHGFLSPVTALLHLGGEIQHLQADVERLDDVLENPAIADGGQSSQVPAAGKKPRTRLLGDISVCNIEFGYSPVDPPLIRDLTVDILSGRSLALVGGSGSGKSTLAKIIVGLLAPTNGLVTFDGKPREFLNQGILESSIGYVDQDTFIFAGSVRANITLWDPSISDKAVVRALQDAMLEDVVMSLPGGLDAHLAEGGANLSGGQRQRLEIARALVNNPSILVLDEATSGLDAETEAAITANIRLRGCTCLVVAHRLSTVRDCDEIVVMRHGKIVESGSHASLMAMNGLYFRLVASDEREYACPA